MDYYANFLFSVNVIAPIMLVMLVGYLVKHFKIIDDNTVSQCNSLVFKVFLPILLFNNVRDTSLSVITGPGLFFLVIAAIVLSFVAVTLIVVLIEKDNPKRGAMIQGICRSNYAFFGLPMLALLMPNEDLAIASLLVAIVIPLYNICSVVVFSIFGQQKLNIKNLFLNIAKNPLIIAIVLGALVLLSDLKLPMIVDSPLKSIGTIASAFALFMLGAQFNIREIGRVGRQLLIVCLGKLIIVPTIIVLIAIALGFRSLELACLIVIFYAPTATSAYVMAEAMGGDKDLAAASVVLTTVLSIVTMFAVIFIFSGLELI